MELRSDFCARAWLAAPPFAVNPRGILTHMVAHVSTYFRDGERTHHHADYLCGNGTNFRVGCEGDVLTDSPPDDRLLCAACECRASRKKLPTGDELAGRHVHRGVLVAQQICCEEEGD